MSKPKLCVFCGQHPVGKTKEHIIPQWLIEMTGDPNRQINLGPFISKFAQGDESMFREFSFNSLTFPACKSCNEQFSDLETKVKPVVEKLLNNRPLSAFDFDLLLDWFDKVRIGLWIGYFLYLDANFWQIEPHFFISDRIGKADRALLIYKSAQNFNGIRFVGVNTPAFFHVPSCFTLTINNFFLLNASHQYFLAKKAGFPYAYELKFLENETFRGVLDPGTGFFESPLLDFKYDPGCSIIGQSIFTQHLDPAGEIDLAPIQYFQDHLLEGNKTRPILQKEDTISWYPLEPSDSWIPLLEHNLKGLKIKNAVQTLKIQNFFVQKIPIAEEVPEEKATAIRENMANCVAGNNTLISIVIKDQWNL